jgi:WD40 repeat protein
LNRSLICRILIIFLFLLSACQLQNPVEKSNNSASSSPAGNESFIPDQADSLCEAALNSQIITGAFSPPIRTLVKKLYQDGTWTNDPNSMMVPHIEPMKDTSEVSSILCISENRSSEITYPDNRIGYKLHWDARVILYPSGQTVGSNSFEGDAPPDLETYEYMKDYIEENEVYGDSPSGRLLEWLFPLLDGLKIYANGTPIFKVDLSPRGDTLAIGGSSNLVTLLNYKSGMILKQISLPTVSVSGLAFSPDGASLALPGDAIYKNEPIQLWNTTTYTSGRSFFADQYLDVNSMAFSPDGSMLATGSYDGTIYVWDQVTGNILRSLKGHTDMIQDLAFSPDSHQLVSGCFDGSVILWDTNSGIKMRSFDGHTDSVDGVAFSPDGAMIATGSMDNSVILWDAATGKQVKKIIPEDNEYSTAFSVSCVAFSPDGTLVAFADPLVIKLWNIDKKSIVASFSGHTGAVSSIVFSPDGGKLISGSIDTTVMVWDVRQ